MARQRRGISLKNVARLLAQIDARAGFGIEQQYLGAGLEVEQAGGFQGIVLAAGTCTFSGTVVVLGV